VSEVLNNNQVLLSILMPVYNGEKYLKETLECVTRQTFKNFELIILDNQSNDNSQKIIKSFQKRDARIRYILDTKKRNGNDCFSILIKHALGKYLIVLNDDNYLDQNFFLKLIEKIQETNSDMVICNGYYINENSKKKKIFFKKNIYFKGRPNIFKIINFFFKGDVIPLLLSSVILQKTFKNMLPYLNLSKFENDADTLMGIKILSNLKIDVLEETLFYCRVYDYHERYHENKMPKNFFSFLKEKLIHDINLINYSINAVFNSKLGIIIKIIFIIFFPLLLIIKRIKNFLIECILKFRKLI